MAQPEHDPLSSDEHNTDAVKALSRWYCATIDIHSERRLHGIFGWVATPH